jgi:GTP cyclohydrolase I
MNTIKLLRNLAKYFPKSLQEDYDHSGLQINFLKEDTKTIVLALDCDKKVIDFAKEKNADLILTHHPFLFGTRRQITSKFEYKDELCQILDALKIPVYSMHTNFDKGINGMNDALASALELKNIKHVEGYEMMRGGDLPYEMSIEELAKYAKNKLGVTYGLLLPYGKKMCHNVAIIGGGGWMEYYFAYKAGYDAYISGDIPHHGRREIEERHYNYIDLPHEIEKIFMPQMKKLLLEIDPSLKIFIIDQEILPIVI